MEAIRQMPDMLEPDGQFTGIGKEAAQALGKTAFPAIVRPGPEQTGSTGDSLFLSQEARDAYTGASASSGESAASPAAASAPIEAYTSSGHKVTVFVETYLNESGGEAKRAMVRLDGRDGQSRVLALEDSLVITEDDAGNLVGFGAGKDGVLHGTSGNDVIISFGASVYAGDGDDAIVVVRDFDLFRYEHLGITVDAGNGDDTLVADLLSLSDIDMGDGDDVLVADTVNQHHPDAAIAMGKGHDTVRINRLYGRISLGEGNDVLVAGLSGGTIDAGDGDDVLHLGDFSAGTIRAGAGNDVIHAKSVGVVAGLAGRSPRASDFLLYRPGVTIDGGSGTTEIHVREDVRDAFVYGGSGNTTLNARNVISSIFHDVRANISGEMTSSLMNGTLNALSGYEKTEKNADPELIETMHDFLEQYLPTNLKI
jgi:hypothetical protein